VELAGWLGAEVVRDPADVRRGQRVHLHVTDRLLGSDPSALLDVVARLARRARLTLTLHDVPQPTDGARTFERRVATYRALVASADGWATNSDHEAALVHHWCRPATPGLVVPLPVIPAATPRARVEAGTVGLFGYVYPGKGHRPVLDAVGLLRRRGVPARVVVLGGAAAGHDRDLRALTERADALGVPIEVTGRLPEESVPAALRSVAVPVVGHRNVSASGSLNSWLAAGRRPLVRTGTYAREMAALRPGTTTLFEHGRLVSALATALAEPERTWLPAAVDLQPGPVETADAYRTWWSGVAVAA
jgi:glycosyltransferase involved in cell wall biosynthesis